MPETGVTYQKAIEEQEKQEKAQARKDRRHGLVSYHSFTSEDISGEEMIPDPGASIEELVEQREEQLEHYGQLHSMWTGLTLLREDEFLIIKKIFLDGLGIREYSRRSKIPLTTLERRVQNILTKLRCFTNRL